MSEEMMVLSKGQVEYYMPAGCKAFPPSVLTCLILGSVEIRKKCTGLEKCVRAFLGFFFPPEVIISQSPTNQYFLISFTVFSGRIGSPNALFIDSFLSTSITSSSYLTCKLPLKWC